MPCEVGQISVHARQKIPAPWTCFLALCKVPAWRVNRVTDHLHARPAQENLQKVACTNWSTAKCMQITRPVMLRSPNTSDHRMPDDETDIPSPSVYIAHHGLCKENNASHIGISPNRKVQKTDLQKLASPASRPHALTSSRRYGRTFFVGDVLGFAALLFITQVGSSSGSLVVTHFECFGEGSGRT